MRQLLATVGMILGLGGLAAAGLAHDAEMGASGALADTKNAAVGILAPAGSVSGGGAAATIPVAELGARAGALLQPEATAVVVTPEGARLAAPLQDLVGHLESAGLRVESAGSPEGGGQVTIRPRWLGRADGSGAELPTAGQVSLDGAAARLERDGLGERLTASGDGLRQDFVLDRRPAGAGELRLELALAGATAEQAGERARLTLAESGRQLAYGGLRVLDADERELPARMRVVSAERIALEIDDRAARYPLLIDPTLSDEDWVNIGFGAFAGANGVVSALAVDDGTLYVGGSFTAVGNTLANRVATWNGSEWSALGAGINGGVVSVLALDAAGNLYAGGNFLQAGGVAASNIARWDGTAWNALGAGTNDRVSSLALDPATGQLYAGGYFTQAGGIDVNRIARWNGGAWSALGAGMNREVRALALSAAGQLYAGGQFTQAGEVVANYIARWDGSAWSALGAEVNNKVAALVIDAAGDLYAGGWFTQAGGIDVNYIARWDGNAWSPLGTGTAGGVLTLVLDAAGHLYAGGQFAQVGEVAANHIARWDGSAWSALGAGTSHEVAALAIDAAGNLYAGGWFMQAGGVPANNIARWHIGTATWSALGTGTGGIVFALALDPATSQLYAGGNFLQAGGVRANNIARWDGSAWNALGAGIGTDSEAVQVLVLDPMTGHLYAGGGFTEAGGMVARNIARWNGTAWSALGAGTNDVVMTLALDSVTGQIYAGGWFTQAGGVDTNHIARWDGRAWSALGTGTNNAVLTLVLDSSTGHLYAGGGFTQAGGIDANYIARWNGMAWSACGAGANSWVYALAHDDAGHLYAGGGFADADGVTFWNIARWDGTAWSALGDGGPMGAATATLALALDPIAGHLYAGGWFTQADGVAARNIARWDGSVWSALGSGTDDGIRALALDSATQSLFVGGGFSAAGGQFSSFVAQYNLGAVPPPPATYRLSVSTSGSGTVASAPAGIDCGATCAASFASGTDVTLTASPASGYRFGSWSGCTPVAGFPHQCTLGLTANRAVTAQFSPAPRRVVEIPDIVGDAGRARQFRILIPNGARDLTVRTTGTGTGNVDLYVRHGGAATVTQFDCRSVAEGLEETCVIAAPRAGDHYLLLQGIAPYRATLTVSWQPS